MDGLARLCGRGPVISVCNRRLQVRARTLRHWGEMEQQIKYERGNVFEQIRLFRHYIDDPEVLKETVTDAVNKVLKSHYNVTASEVYKWAATWRGRLFSFWLAVRDNGVTHDESHELFCRHFNEILRDQGRDAVTDRAIEIEYAIDLASGEDEFSQAEWMGDVQTGRRTKVDEGDKPIPWDYLFKKYIIDRKFTPAQFLDMTVRDVRVLGQSDGRLQFQFEGLDGEAFLMTLRESKAKMVDQLCRGKRCNPYEDDHSDD